MAIYTTFIAAVLSLQADNYQPQHQLPRQLLSDGAKSDIISYVTGSYNIRGGTLFCGRAEAQHRHPSGKNTY